MNIQRENSAPIFTDTWNPGIGGKTVPEGELLPGELSAATFRVGCYIVRSAVRVYKLHYPDDNKGQMRKKPADPAEVGIIRKNNYYKAFIEPIISGGVPSVTENLALATAVQMPLWECGLYAVNEISAKHIKSADSGFVYICSAKQCINMGDMEGIIKESSIPETSSSYEYIGDIYAFKEQESFSDDSASLLIYKHYENSRQGVDTWYRLKPSGRVTSSEEAPFGLTG